MAELVRCPGCGAEVKPTGTCRFCGATAFVDGVAGRLLPSTLKCPRCPKAPPLSGLEHEGFRADLCMKCHGVWFGMGVLEEVIRSAAKRKVKTGEGSEGPVHGGVEPVRYARCPVCGGGMARLPFAQKPLVIIDQCPSHGEWCDGGELAQLKTVARSRGVDEALGRSLRPAPPKAETSKSAAAVKAGLEGDALIAEMRKRGGSWRLLPSSMEDAPRNIFTSRRRGRHDLFDVIWYLLDL